MVETPIPGGDLERQVLVALWEIGRGPARAIHQQVNDVGGTELAYTTIATVLERLHEKGLVNRRRTARVVLYEARHSRDKVEKARASAMLKGLLGSEPRQAIAMLVEAAEGIDPDLVDELARVVRARRKARRGS